MNDIDSDMASILPRDVPDSERLDVLPRHFGRAMLLVEHSIYSWMRTLSTGYTGGYWRYVELSNGGFYMSPQTPGAFKVNVEGNGFEAEMSAEAAGITACLFALSHLSFQNPAECLATHYHLLRDFALSHPEASSILAAID
jgi:hypothetical protein